MFIYHLTFIAGLVLCLARAEMICEGKTYSKKLIKMDQLGNYDQVIVKKSGMDEVVGQYFCDNGKCKISHCVGLKPCFKNESGYLVLIMYNISPSDRFDASRNFVTPIFLNFTLDEDVPSTSTTPAVPDETPLPRIKPTEPIHPNNTPEARTGEALSTGAIVAIAILAIVVVVVLLVLVDVEIARRAGRDAMITKVFTCLRRKSFDPVPNKEGEIP